jgi:hypothetical protein
MLRATVSGSFHRHMVSIYNAVGTLREHGVDVLSPSDPRVVDHLGEFLFVASDRLRSIKLVQDRHFEAIRRSDFLWVVCPDGYTGVSTAAEVGAAYAMGTPIFSDTLALDITMQQYINKVDSIAHAMSMIGEIRERSPICHVLLDPSTAIEGSIAALERLKPVLEGRTSTARGEAERSYNEVMTSLFVGHRPLRKSGTF